MLQLMYGVYGHVWAYSEIHGIVVMLIIGPCFVIPDKTVKTFRLDN